MGPIVGDWAPTSATAQGHNALAPKECHRLGVGGDSIQFGDPYMYSAYNCVRCLEKQPSAYRVCPPIYAVRNLPFRIKIDPSVLNRGFGGLVVPSVALF